MIFMKLKKFRIQNFRSLVDSGEINVAPIMCLIGPNESGKSSILQGLATLSMDSKYDYFDLTELNGVMKKFNDGELLSKDIRIIWTEFELTEDEKKELKNLVQEVGTDFSNVEISKYFDESYEVVVGNKKFRIPSRYKFTSAQEKIKSILTNFQNQANAHLQRPPNNRFAPQFNEIMNEMHKIVTEKISKDNALALLQKLEEFSTIGIDQQFKSDITNIISSLKSIINENFPSGQAELSLYNFLLTRMPRTVYFKSYERMEDCVPINELKNNPQAHRTFINFLKLAGIKLDVLERLADDRQKQVYIENGCGKATKLLREAWRQEVLDVELRYSDGKLMVFTKNSAAIETLLPPSCGSEGFQWFFAFYINFGAATEAEYKRAILLLDDPGVFLHPKGHKDLLKLFEQYAQRDVMIIYSTHLPFLIPRENIERLRLVQRGEGGYSFVVEKFWATSDKDVLYPIRAALGVTLADSLFVGKKTIITEGPSGKILLQGMLKEFHHRNIKVFDLENLEVIGAMGAQKAIDIALLLEIERLPYVVVLDNDDEGRRVEKEAEKRGIPKERVILLHRSQIPTQQDFEIEDLFPPEIYAEAFYSIYGQRLGVEKPKILERFKEGSGKIVNKAKDILKSANLDLDKITVARKVLDLLSKEKELDQNTKEIFSELFNKINSQIQIFKD
jgi:predicted ATP-dependent endonuclease of OLD family